MDFVHNFVAVAGSKIVAVASKMVAVASKMVAAASKMVSAASKMVSVESTVVAVESKVVAAEDKIVAVQTNYHSVAVDNPCTCAPRNRWRFVVHVIIFTIEAEEMCFGNLASGDNFRFTHNLLFLIAYGHDISAIGDVGLKPLASTRTMSCGILSSKAGNYLRVRWLRFRFWYTFCGLFFLYYKIRFRFRFQVLMRFRD